MSENPANTFKPRLYDLSWGLYPRRVTIYLQERGLVDAIDIMAVGETPAGLADVPGKPAGTVPILEASPGVYIRQSSAILEYLEEAYTREPGLHGDSAVARAHDRELMGIADEITTMLSLYVRQASELFAPLGEQSRATATTMLKRMHALLTQLEGMADGTGPFLVQGRGATPSVVDCIMLSTWQFADHVYAVDIFKGHDRLQAFLEAMLRRDSAKMPSAPDFILENSRKMSVT